MTNEFLTLIVAHFACSDLAESRHLTADEVMYCSAVYQEVKLAFVPGVDPRHFVELSFAEQHAVNRAGFLAFLEWRAEHPDTVAHLERVARGEAPLGRAG